jgi:uncharacterized linocin/CFP29 family protein
MTEAMGGQVGQAGIDTVQGMGAVGSGRTLVSGSVGQRLLSANFDVQALRPCSDVSSGLSTNATLLRDEWIQFDTVVQQVARERLPVVAELISRGLVMKLPNALGVMNIEWERVKGDLVNAEVTMSGLNEATKDRMEYEYLRMPVPIFHKEFFYNLRHLETARRHGRQLDVEHAAVATRKIAELIETVLFNGLTIAGGTVYGLTTEPNRKTLSVSTTWVTATGSQIISDILRMIDLAQGASNNFEGPFVLFVPRTIASRFGDDYKTNSDKTIMDRVMEIPGIQKVIQTSRLPGTQALLVQMTSDVLQMIDGIQPTMVEWDSHGGFQQNFKVIAIMLPRVRSDGFQQSGIVQIS